MVDIAAAVAYVHSHGDQVELCRLEYMLNGQPPSPQVSGSLFAEQRQDGGWSPFWVQDYSSLDATCFRLAQAEQLGITVNQTAVQLAVGFLNQRQQSNGSWEEDESVRESAPPWAKPGNLAASLYLTANCGFWLVMFQGVSVCAQNAGIYLQDYLREDGKISSFLHTHWLAGGLWMGLGWKEQADLALMYLETRLEDLSASGLAWLIVSLRIAGVPLERKIIRTANGLLEEAQCDDGHWTSEDGEAFDVNATLEALRALKLCGRF
jgi:hypothetical protein